MYEPANVFHILRPVCSQSAIHRQSWSLLPPNIHGYHNPEREHELPPLHVVPDDGWHRDLVSKRGWNNMEQYQRWVTASVHVAAILESKSNPYQLLSRQFSLTRHFEALDWKQWPNQGSMQIEQETGTSWCKIFTVNLKKCSAISILLYLWVDSPRVWWQDLFLEKVPTESEVSYTSTPLLIWHRFSWSETATRSMPRKVSTSASELGSTIWPIVRPFGWPNCNYVSIGN